MDTFVFSGTGFFVQLLNIIVLAALIGAFVLLVLALLKYLRRKETNSQRMCIQKSLGENIREKRVQLKMTQEFVAERIGVSRQAVSKWESGKSDPSTANLMALAGLFEIETEELLKGKAKEAGG